MNKLRILIRVANKFLRKTFRGDFRYRGKGYLLICSNAMRYLLKVGPKGFIRKLKTEIISIDRHLGANLAFPNGLVTGVDADVVELWYEEHSRPVTIVIPSYNDYDYLVPCIESIGATTDSKKVKIIIVDDYCQSVSQNFLKTLENDQISVVYRKKNGGFAKAVNTGLEAANKKHDVVLLNSDIVAQPGWIEALQYGAYEFGVDTGVVGPKLLYPDGRIQSAGSYRNTEVPEYFDHYYRFQDANYGPANIPQYCIAVTGACMYVKREFIQQVGILDEKFEFAFEEVDWCIRGWEEGYRTLYFPSATLTHNEGVTRSKNKTISIKEKKSVDYFWEKWGKWFDERNVKNKKGNIRIIFVLQSFGLSGGIKNIFELANRLSMREFAVEIWGLDRKQPDWEVGPGLKMRTFKNYERLTEALAGEEAIKVATWWETAFPVWLASVQKGIPVYFISEIETWFYPNDVISQSTVISCYRKEFRNLTISSYNLEEIRALGLNATLLPCGYEDTVYKVLPRIKREKDVLLGVGRSFFQKNFDMTLKGWKLIGDNRPKMWLFGFEPHLAKLDSKITYFNKPTNEGVNELLNKATMFVQTSRHEGFCLPVLEAMAAGCPVICTDSHGNRDFSFDGKNCLIVDQEDEAGLAIAVKKLLSNKPLRDKLAKEGIKTAKEFKWDVITDKAEKLFKEVR